MAQRLPLPLIGSLMILLAVLPVQATQAQSDQCEYVSSPGSGGGGVNPHYWAWEDDNTHYVSKIGTLQKVNTNFGGDGDVHFKIVPNGSENSLGTEINVVGHSKGYGDAYLMPFLYGDNGAFHDGMRVWAEGYWVSDRHGAWFNPMHQPQEWPEIHPLNQLIGQDGGETPGAANNFSVFFALDASDRFDACLTRGRSFSQEFDLRPFPERVDITASTPRTTRTVGTVKEESHLDFFACGNRSSAYLRQSLLDARFSISATLGSPEPEGGYWPFYIGKFERGSAKDVFADKVALDVGTCADFGLPTSPITSADTKALRITWTIQTNRDVWPRVSLSTWALERSVPAPSADPNIAAWEGAQARSAADGATPTATFVRYYAPGCGAVLNNIPRRFPISPLRAATTGKPEKANLDNVALPSLADPAQQLVRAGDYTTWQYGPYAKHSWKLIMRGWDSSALSSNVNALLERVGVLGEVCPSSIFYNNRALEPTTRHLVAKEITYRIPPSKMTLRLDPSTENLAEGEFQVQGTKCSYSSWTSAVIKAKKELAPLAGWVGDVRWHVRIVRDRGGQTCVDSSGNLCPWVDLNAESNKTHDFGWFRASIAQDTGDALLLNAKTNGVGEHLSFPGLVAVRAIAQTNFGEWPSANTRVVSGLRFSCGADRGEDWIEQVLGRAILAAQALQRGGIWQPDKPFPEHLASKPVVALQPLTKDIDMLVSSLPPGPIRETVEDYFLFQQGAHLSSQKMHRLVRFLNLPNLVILK